MKPWKRPHVTGEEFVELEIRRSGNFLANPDAAPRELWLFSDRNHFLNK
jgi:hypothetical protein